MRTLIRNVTAITLDEEDRLLEGVEVALEGRGSPLRAVAQREDLGGRIGPGGGGCLLGHGPGVLRDDRVGHGGLRRPLLLDGSDGPRCRGKWHEGTSRLVSLRHRQRARTGGQDPRGYRGL